MFDVVVPTIGRGSLGGLLEALAAGEHRPRRIVVVDDRRRDRPPRPLLSQPPSVSLRERLVVVRGRGEGPAAARNRGWRLATAPWVVFLDDDVVVPPGWSTKLVADLDGASDRTAGVQGCVVVPLPTDRRPTDHERMVAGLASASWATADMAYRRAALAEVGGFDPTFPRAYREDADLAVRVQAAGWSLVRGDRTVLHPVGPGGRWESVRRQRGNADDARMRARHGPGWRSRAVAPRGRLALHGATVAAATGALGALIAGRRRGAAAAGSLWLGLTGAFAWARIGPGPRTRDEVATMVVTSIAIPPVAVAHRAAGEVAARIARRRPALGRPAASQPDAPPAAVLFDRDGTLVEDVPYNRDPERVTLRAEVAPALDVVRACGIRSAIVTNQSGVGRGWITPAELDRVNARVSALTGIDVIEVCPHTPEVGCDCRKPRPGAVQRALEALSVAPGRAAMVGDIGADVEAARSAGVRGVLVPTPVTRGEEIVAATEVAPTLLDAVRLLAPDDPPATTGAPSPDPWHPLP